MVMVVMMVVIIGVLVVLITPTIIAPLVPVGELHVEHRRPVHLAGGVDDAVEPAESMLEPVVECPQKE